MLLRNIKIRGFKSFPDIIEVSLESGITAIVGPNGCGKSNIADSINWAFGEQSPTSLRGKKMEQMIFNGSSSRKASGMAEVTVTLVTNGDLTKNLDISSKEESKDLERDGASLQNILASADGDITITRRMFRDAQSEYALNGQPCRLRDIQDLLMALGIGSRAITIVEQEKINSILNAKPVDRRVLIEDAAGITKFKLNKHLTQLKLDRAAQNLLRIEDLLAEQEVHVRRLRRQAARARRYRRTLAEIREIEAALLASRHAELRKQQEETSGQVREMEDSLANVSAALASAESTQAETRQRADELTNKQVETREKHYHSSLEIDRDANRLKHLRESLDALFVRSEEARSRQAEAQRRSEEREQRIEQAKQNCRKHESELESARKEYELLRHQADSADADLDGIRNRRDESMIASADLREAIAVERSRREALIAEERRLATAIANAKVISKKHTEAVSETENLISNIESDKTELEGRILENDAAVQRVKDNLNGLDKEIAAFDRRLENLRSSYGNTEATLAALQEMEEKHEGIEEAARAILEKEELRSAVQPLGIVADMIELKGPMADAALAAYGRLFEAVVVENDAAVLEAVEILRQEKLGRATFIPLSSLPDNPPPPAGDGDPRQAIVPRGENGQRLLNIFPTAVTVENLQDALQKSADGARAVLPDGTVVRKGKTIRGGSKARLEQIFSRRSRIEELVKQKDLLHEELNGQAEHRKDFETRRDDLKSELVELTKANEKLRIELTELVVKAKSASEERDRRIDAAGDEERKLATLAKQHQEAITGAEAAAKQILELEKQLETLSAELEGLNKQLQSGSETVGQARERENKLRASISAAEERFKAEKSRVESLEADRKELETEQAATQRQLESLEEQRLEHLHEIEAIEAGTPDKVEANEALRRSLSELDSRLDELTVELKKLDQETKRLRSQQEELKEKLEQHKLAFQEKIMALEHIREKASENLKLDASALETISVDGELLDPEEAEVKLTGLKEKVERIGPVNLMAGEEYEKHQKRYNFLAEQRKDIVDSIESLEQVISRIDRISRSRFREAFDRINENFHNTFRRLFGGGRSELALGEGDLLDAGVDILVQPPGKRLQSATLLSGGEKSLAAFALIMAVLEYRPSPFCVLDEADAALDEPNIKRVASILREHSDRTQFILITHNKATMEIADRLYGVTMEEPGISKVVSVKFN